MLKKLFVRVRTGFTLIQQDLTRRKNQVATGTRIGTRTILYPIAGGLHDSEIAILFSSILCYDPRPSNVPEPVITSPIAKAEIFCD